MIKYNSLFVIFEQVFNWKLILLIRYIFIPYVYTLLINKLDSNILLLNKHVHNLYLKPSLILAVCSHPIVGNNFADRDSRKSDVFS